MHLPSIKLIAALLPDIELPPEPFSAAGKLIHEGNRTRLDNVRMELGSINATVDGELNPGNSFKLDIDTSGPDISVLNELIGQDLEPWSFALKTQLAERNNALAAERQQRSALAANAKQSRKLLKESTAQNDELQARLASLSEQVQTLEQALAESNTKLAAT